MSLRTFLASLSAFGVLSGAAAAQAPQSPPGGLEPSALIRLKGPITSVFPKGDAEDVYVATIK